MSLSAFLATQRRLERQFRGFLSSLDASRTATLREVLQQPRSALTRLRAHWCNVDMLASRLEKMERFFDALPHHPNIRRGAHLAFFQANSSGEDEIEHRKKCEENEFFRHEYQSFPPEAFYLHTRTNFLWRLRGAWREGRVIHPLNHFSSYGDRRWRQKPLIVGMRVPNYPAMLGISPHVATDYLARIIVHDFGHSFLPEVDPRCEALHNVVMIYAMDSKNNDDSSDPWDMIVHRECTDPCFVLEAPNLLTDGTMTPTPAGSVLLRDLRRLYCSRRREQRLKELWSIDPRLSLHAAQQRMVDTIQALCSSGFETYKSHSLSTA